MFDLTRSAGSYLVDAITGRRYSTCSFVASAQYELPGAGGRPGFHAELMQAALNKPSNLRRVLVAMARFTRPSARVLGDPCRICSSSKGAPQVENAPVVRLEESAQPPMGSTRRWAIMLHLRGAFHGRKSYTVADQHQADHYRPNRNSTGHASMRRYMRLGLMSPLWPR